ncbi:MAG: hypothetical protein WBF06_14595 [Candidatus Acidiferrales bacterium]
MKEHTRIGRGVFTKWIFVVCLAGATFCGSANARRVAARTETRANADGDASQDASKIQVRNNAASLLYGLLGDEKSVDKILLIKHPRTGLKRVIKAISKTAGDGQDQLDALAKDDKTLDLHALELPPGEMATRDAIRKTDEHDLIFSWGVKFDMDLLLSQTDALNYGSHLAKIAADNSTSPEQQKQFHALDVALNAMFNRVVANIRALPAK